MNATRTRHPAAYPKYILERLTLILGAEARQLGRPVHVLDPFAGVGRIHDLPERVARTTGVEIEPEWANCRAGTIVGDATSLPADWTARFDAVVTSPCYGSRMADHHEAKDACALCRGTGVAWTPDGCGDAPMLCPDCHDVACACGGFAVALRAHNRSCHDCQRRLCPRCKGSGTSTRYTYRHALGRPLHERNAGQMQWGDAYRQLHEEAWREAHRVLRHNGLILVNVKNHVRGGVEQLVVEWHAQALQGAGFKVLDIQELETRGLPVGANASTRVACESIIVGRSR